MAIAVFLTTLSGVLWGWSWMAAADWAVLDPLHDYGAAHPLWVDGWNLLCNVLHPAVFRLLALIWIGWALWRGRYRVAIFLMLTVEASGLVVVLVKALVDRPRPDTALVDEFSSSFPSGHALGITVAVIAMTIVAWDRLGRWRTTTVVMGVLAVLMVGFGRVVLNVHHPSDVLAGWALGYLWVLIWLPVLILPEAMDEKPVAPGTEP